MARPGIGEPPATIKIFVITKKGNDFQVMAPAKRVVCYCCRGKGTHVNPNVDGDGITPEEFDRDPEFLESYLSGVFDVQCEECKGERVLDVVDESKMTPKMLERYYRHLDMEAADRAMHMAEIRAGA